MADETLKLILEVDTASGQASVQQFTGVYNQAKDQWTQGPKEAAAANKGLISSFTDMYFAGKLAMDAIGAITDKVMEYVDAAARREQIESRTAFQLQAAGYQYQEIKVYVDQFAESIRQTTRFSEEAATQGLGHMMQYTTDIKAGMEGVKLAMDMATQTGMDFDSTTRLIGMAMNGNVEIMGRWIPELRDLEAHVGANATAADKWAYAQDVLNGKFAGGAQKDLETYAGKVAQLKNEWEEMKESTGKALLPIAKSVVEAVKNITDGWVMLTQNRHWYRDLEAKDAASDAAKKRAEETAELLRRQKALEVEAQAWRVNREKRNAMELEFNMKRLQMEGDTEQAIEGERWKAVAEAEKIGAATYDINRYYDDMQTKRVNDEIDKRIAAEKRFRDAEKAMREEAAALAKEWKLDEIFGPQLDVTKVKDQFDKLLNAMMGTATPEQIELLKQRLREKLDEIQTGAVEKWAAKIPEGNQGQENWMVQFLATPALDALDKAIKGALDEMEQFRVGIQNKPAIMEIKVLDDDVTRAALDAKAFEKALTETSEKQWIVNVETVYTSTGSGPLTVAAPATPEYHEAWLADQMRAERNAEALWRPYFSSLATAISETGNEFIGLYKTVENVPNPVIRMNYDSVVNAGNQAGLLDQQLVEMEKKRYRVEVDLVYKAEGAPASEEGYHINLPTDLPQFGAGGVVDRPTLALIGEKGKREYVIPEDKMGGGVSITVGQITVAGGGATGSTIARDLDEALADLWQHNRSKLKVAMRT